MAPEEAEVASRALELGGLRLELAGEPLWSDGLLARRARVADAGSVGPAPARRALSGPEDVLLWADPALAPMAVAAGHLAPEEDAWRLAPRFVLDETWHGALVLARADGAWVGLLLVEEGGGRIVSLPSD